MAAGMSAPKENNVFPVGTVSRRACEITFCCVMFWVSTSGVWPDTVTVSSSPPTFSSTFNVAVKLGVSSRPSRLNGAKPGSVNVTV